MRAWAHKHSNSGGASHPVRDVVLLLRLGVVGDHNIEPVGKGAKLLRNRLPCLAPHDDRVTFQRVLGRSCQLLEELHVATQRPGHGSAQPNPTRLLARSNHHGKTAHLLKVHGAQG